MFFQNSVIKKYLAALNTEQVTAAWEVYKAYFLNKEIDERVYALYGLTEEEIKVIEE